MRVLLLLLVVMLAGCSDKAPAEAPESDPPAGVSEAEPAVAEDGAEEAAHPFLGKRICELDRAFATTPVAVDGAFTGAVCRFSELDLPEATRSVRVHFNWSAAAGELGISVRDDEACGSGGTCELASASGPDLVLDITDSVRGVASWYHVYVAIEGQTVLPAWSMELLFYAAPDPAKVPPLPVPVVEGDPFLGQVPCTTEDAVVVVGAGFEGTGTSGVCRFADLDLPDGLRSARVWFNWSADASASDLGLVLRDVRACNDGRDCELARVAGASPVQLDIGQDTLEGAQWEDLELTVSGEALQPDWTFDVLWYATPSPP